MAESCIATKLDTEDPRGPFFPWSLPFASQDDEDDDSNNGDGAVGRDDRGRNQSSKGFMFRTVGAGWAYCLGVVLVVGTVLSSYGLSGTVASE
jgi:hypothetical protein